MELWKRYELENNLGMYRAPRSGKFIGGLKLLAKRAPILGGNFALWGGLFSLCDCTLTLWRNKESPWNQVAGGFITGGLLAARGNNKSYFSWSKNCLTKCNLRWDDFGLHPNRVDNHNKTSQKAIELNDDITAVGGDTGG